jgi:hypothetical protein
METRTEISRQNPKLLSAEQVAKAIGTNLETINEWLDVGAVDRAVFGGGRFSRYELHRVEGRISTTTRYCECATFRKSTLKLFQAAQNPPVLARWPRHSLLPP